MLNQWNSYKAALHTSSSGCFTYHSSITNPNIPGSSFCLEQLAWPTYSNFLLNSWELISLISNSTQGNSQGFLKNSAAKEKQSQLWSIMFSNVRHWRLTCHPSRDNAWAPVAHCLHFGASEFLVTSRRYNAAILWKPESPEPPLEETWQKNNATIEWNSSHFCNQVVLQMRQIWLPGLRKTKKERERKNEFGKNTLTVFLLFSYQLVLPRWVKNESGAGSLSECPTITQIKCLSVKESYFCFLATFGVV